MPGTVLVADDEPLTAEMLALMLTYRGYGVVCAHDGAEALDTARELQPDIILLDVIMPGLEGDVVARALRRDPRLADCLIVLFSSYDEADIAWQEAGADMFMQKPIDIMALPEILRCLLDGDEPPRSPRLHCGAARQSRLPPGR